MSVSGPSRLVRLFPIGVVVAALATALLSACNTTAGFGKDMQSAGAAIENKADRNK